MSIIKNTKDKVSGAINRLKDKIIDKTSDVLSAPVRGYYDDARKRTDKAYNDIVAKREEGYKKNGHPESRKNPDMQDGQKKAMQRKTIQIGTSTPKFKQYGDKEYRPSTGKPN